jgi:RNA polymerase sigma factor (sigma-70 family)
MRTLLSPAKATFRWSPRALRLGGSRHNQRVNSLSTSELSSLQASSLSLRSDEEAQLQAWVAGMAQGQSSALEQLYDASVARVYSLVRRFVPDDASAQDVVQEVYLQAWTQASRFEPARGAAMAWLLNLARSRALDAWRKLSSQIVTANSEMADTAAADWKTQQQPADFLDAIQTSSQLQGALAQLPATTRQMLSLAFFHDMTHAEISAHLQMPLGTVKSTLRRALLALRDHLQHTGLAPAHLAALTLEDTP